MLEWATLKSKNIEKVEKLNIEIFDFDLSTSFDEREKFGKLECFMVKCVLKKEVSLLINNFGIRFCGPY